MHPQKKRGFTLVELLVVMMIIVILAGLILAIMPIVNYRQAHTRAENEIKSIGVALESYKADNGSYPTDAILGAGAYTKNYTDNLDARTANDPTATGNASYTNASLVLYRALSGDRDLSRKAPATNPNDVNYDLDGNSLATPLAAPPTPYWTPPGSMLLPSGGTGTVTALVDPFGYPYGYSTAYQGDLLSTGTNNPPPTHGFNPTYDLWSTGGQVVVTTDGTTQIQQKRAKWIYNWQSSGSGTSGNAGQ